MNRLCAFDVFHDQIVGLVLTEIIHDLWQGSVSQVAQERRFVFERAACFAVIDCGGLFQCHDAVDALVQSFLNRAHAAVSELAKNAITILQHCAYGEHGC